MHHSQLPDKRESSWQLLKPRVGVDDEKKTGGVQETAEKGGVDDTNEEDFSSGSRPFWCTWNPSNQGQCQDLLQDELPPPPNKTKSTLALFW